MRRRTNTNAVDTIVYAYGGAYPLAGWDHAQAEMARQRALWDRLVALDREHEQRLLDLAGKDVPAITKLMARIQDMSAQFDALVADRRARRQAARKRIATPELDAEIKAMATARRAVWRELFAQVRAWRVTHRELVHELDTQLQAAMREARRGSGCYWCNYNRVLDDFDRARRVRFRGGGPPRFSDPHRDDGVLTVQIQRTRSGLGASAIEIMDGNCAQIWIERADRGWSRLHVRIDAAGTRLIMPIMLHRPLPTDGRVKRVQVTWRIDGAQRRFQAAFTVVRPADPPVAHPGRTALGLDLGFRLQDDGSLLVATGVDSAGDIHRWTMPASWMAQMDYADAAPQQADPTEELRAKRNLRAHLCRERNERYLVAIARPLCQAYAVIAMEQWDMTKTARRKKTETDEPKLPSAARRNRQRACLSHLRDAIVAQARKFGTRIEWVSGPTTQQCASCGERTTPPADRSEQIWTCSTCGHRWDQDVNAARNLLATVVGTPTNAELASVAG